jgi:hypothetical protein
VGRSLFAFPLGSVGRICPALAPLAASFLFSFVFAIGFHLALPCPLRLGLDQTELPAGDGGEACAGELHITAFHPRPGDSHVTVPPPNVVRIFHLPLAFPRLPLSRGICLCCLPALFVFHFSRDRPHRIFALARWLCPLEPLSPRQFPLGLTGRAIPLCTV